MASNQLYVLELGCTSYGVYTTLDKAKEAASQFGATSEWKHEDDDSGEMWYANCDLYFEDISYDMWCISPFELDAPVDAPGLTSEKPEFIFEHVAFSDFSSESRVDEETVCAFFERNVKIGQYGSEQITKIERIINKNDLVVFISQLVRDGFKTTDGSSDIRTDEMYFRHKYQRLENSEA